jgi:lipopolysaccharide transport system ATP-binding protein
MTKAEIKSKFDEIVDFAGVERYIDTPVKRYSSGMYVRLAFAVAAHLEPEILIVDEVLAVGDIEFQKKALGKMKDVSSKNGRTVLFVSHNMAAISTLCNELLLLKNGIINYYGEIKAGIEAYEQSNFSENEMESLLSKISLIDDDFFKLIEFEVSQDNNSSLDFSLSKEIFVILKYTVKRKVLGLRIGVDLIEKKTQTILFRTFHDDRYEKIDFTETGNYTSRLILPKNFLNSGLYTLSISIGIHNVKWIVHDTLKVDITISTTDVFNKYSDKRPGLVMPKLNWETK